MADKEKEKEVTVKVISEAEELPKTIVRRVVTDKLSQLSTNSEISVLRDSLLAFSESARIFIHYLSATANDTCKESNRQTINAEDVFKALEEIDFPEFISPLRASLEEFRQNNAEKKSASSKAKDTNKKAKGKESTVKDTNEKAKNKESNVKDTNEMAKNKESPAKDTNKKAKGKESPAKDTNKKAKRKESSAKSEGRKKRREVEGNGDEDNAD